MCCVDVNAKANTDEHAYIQQSNAAVYPVFVCLIVVAVLLLFPFLIFLLKVLIRKTSIAGKARKDVINFIC